MSDAARQLEHMKASALTSPVTFETLASESRNTNNFIPLFYVNTI